MDIDPNLKIEWYAKNNDFKFIIDVEKTFGTSGINEDRIIPSNVKEYPEYVPI